MNELKRYTLYIQNICDILSILLSFGLSFVLAFYILPGRTSAYASIDPEMYQQFLLVLVLGYIALNVLVLYNDDAFLKRSMVSEMIEVLKIVGYMFVFMIIYMFLLKVSDQYSRFFWILFSPIFAIIDFSARIFAKEVIIPRISEGGFSEKVLLISTKDELEPFLKEFFQSKEWRYRISGIVIMDEDAKGQRFSSIPVLANYSTINADFNPNDADAVLVTVGVQKDNRLRELVAVFQNLGKKIQLEINRSNLDGTVMKLDQFGNTPILTSFDINPVPKRSLILRRFFEIVICLLLLPVLLLVTVIYWIPMALESPGSLFISRACIGKNGRRYNQYRFRTFFGNADERVAKGESPYTVFGNIIRFLHIDGFPQIVNVIFDEIGFVGPRQHVLSDFPWMTDIEKKLIVIRPGIIGPWMFEKEGDPENHSISFFNDWSVLKDIGMVALCVFRYLTGKSPRNHLCHYEKYEQQDFLSFGESIRPFVYEHKEHEEENHIIYSVVKRFFDIIVSLVSIFILSPVFIILCMLIIMDDGEIPLYSQSRLGYRGERINILKFRTMRTDAGNLDKFFTPEQKERYLKEFKLKGDPRITRIGKLLRVSSLDELPQLFNILRGDLSLVGPRPIVESEAKYYGNDIGLFLSVKPGLTGYWQAYARNNATYESGERKAMELYYVKNRGIRLDIRIILKTFGTVLSHEGAEAGSDG